MNAPRAPAEPSPVEILKAGSDGLRGTLRESLADPITGALREGDAQLLKFHGSYQQDDRDVRDERRRQKLEPAYSFMIRTRLPGGVATSQQWLDLDRLATQYGNGHRGGLRRRQPKCDGQRQPAAVQSACAGACGVSGIVGTFIAAYPRLPRNLAG